MPEPWYNRDVNIRVQGISWVAGLVLGIGLTSAVWRFGLGPAEPATTPSAAAPEREPVADSPPAPAVVAEAPSVSERGHKEPRPDEPDVAEENRRLRAYLDDLLGWILDNLSGRFPVPEPMLSHLRPPALSDDFELHPDVADLLRIEPTEQERINRALSRAARVFRAMETQSAWSEWLSPTEAVLYLPADPDAGTRLRDELRAAFDETLGGDRGERLWIVAEPGLAEAFQAFGEEDRVIFFSLVPLPDGMPPLLRVRDERARPGAGDEPARETAVEWLASAPPEAYVRYVDLLVQAEEGETE